MKDKAYSHQTIILCLGYAAWGIFWGGWAALLPAIKSLSGSSDAVFGLVLLGVAIGALPAMFFVGKLLDRFGSSMVAISYLLFGLSIIALCFVKTPLLLGVALLFVGATSGAVDVALNTSVAALEKKSGGRYFNMTQAAFPVAVVVASPLVGMARQFNVAVPTILAVIAAITIITALLNVGVHRKIWSPKDDSTEKNPNFQAYIIKLVIILGLIGAGIHVIENAVEQWSAIFLEFNLHTSAAIASFGPAAYMGMLFIGRLLMQRFGRGLTDKQILVFTMISAAVGMAIVAMAHWPFMALLGFSVAGLGMAAAIPTVFSLLGRTVPVGERGKVIAKVTTIAYFGYLISPPFVGGIASFAGLRCSWLVLSVIAVIFALVFYRFEL